ncbi:AbrB/MazE/SpoVT family DNA-binding domain-containing protein [Candidatus Microgenomates bacterium]|nr:MAG: AbrB/MazE/SpoVT family DNA-binding domain-containing protein [Candidatus Microgenomates bacterium]
MIQKVIQVGNSLAMLIPKDLAQKYGLKKGSKLHVEEDEANQKLSVSTKKHVDDGLTPEYFAWKKNFISENKGLLTKLSKFHGKNDISHA